MEPKKSRKSDLENSKGQLVSIGFIVAISLSLIAFEWNSGPADIDMRWLQSGKVTEIDVLPPVTHPHEELKPPPEVVISDYIKLIDDGIEIPIQNIIWDDIKQDAAIPYQIKSDDIALVNEDEPYIVVEEMPRFKGDGLEVFHRWVQARVKYPSEPLSNNVSGRVHVTFIVEKDGSVNAVKVDKSPHPGLSAEVIRVVESSPKWKPGLQSGMAVRVRFSMDIRFVIE